MLLKPWSKNEQGDILVLFRSGGHPHLAHDIDLPGGEIDIDESIEQALIREVYEETGLRISTESLSRKHSWRTMWGQKQILYTAEANTQDQVVISWEHKSYAWMSPDSFINYQAVDEFMYRSQDWLRREVLDEEATADNSLTSRRSHTT